MQADNQQPPCQGESYSSKSVTSEHLAKDLVVGAVHCPTPHKVNPILATAAQRLGKSCIPKSITSVHLDKDLVVQADNQQPPCQGESYSPKSVTSVQLAKDLLVGAVHCPTPHKVNPILTTAAQWLSLWKSVLH